jgi:hypothetical protein
MNDVLELFRGVGVIVDDALNPLKQNNTDIIWRIKKSFENKNIPILPYSELPTNEDVANFHSISFLLLDWDLAGLVVGISRPQVLADDNIEFIKEFNKKCFAPIFIFSNENTDNIKQKLSDANLYDDTKSNHIFVESKSNLKQARTLFTRIKAWIRKTPSMYVLKEWENSMYQAKHDLFWDFYNTNPMWPNILKQTFQIDGADENHELGSLIHKNLIARTTPPVFDEKILNKNVRSIPKDDLIKVLECERFLKQEKLPADIPTTGDIFKTLNEQNREYQYFINIRPDCDIVHNNNPELYCLRGRIVDDEKIKNLSFNKGSFDEKINHIYIPFIDDGKIIEFLFRDIKIKKWNEIRANRIGRLLPPYITRLQQKYSFYLQRQGLPAIPEKAIGRR